MTGVRGVRTGADEFRVWATDKRPRIPFGIPFVDAATNGGMARSEIAMLMAFSSVGKTNIALNIIRNNPDVPTLMMSVEMSWRMVVVKLAAMQYGVTTWYIENLLKTGVIPKELVDIADRLPLLLCDDTPAVTLKDAKLSFHTATEQLGTPPRLVVWDYMELIGGSGLMSKSEQVDKVSQKLRDWTREFDCSSIVVHQVGKGDSGGDEPLDLSSGRYGGYAPMDMVLGAYAPRLRRGITVSELDACKDDIFIQLLKNRAGQAKPVGVKHRLDHQTLRLDTWSRPVYTKYSTQGVLQ